MAIVTLNEKEKAAMKDLQTQEEMCIKKYQKYKNEAKDPELKTLFSKIEECEKQHYATLDQILAGTVPEVNVNDKRGKEYAPKAHYNNLSEPEDKKNDCYLATDCIGNEKLISGEYNSDIFVCSQPEVRNALADIQVEEQNHAEMLYKYKTVNGMQ
ncbi:MAG: ferritin-like domain-containing protein [Lachnospiraceae bacterium]